MSSRIRSRKTFKRLYECYVTFRPPTSFHENNNPSNQSNGYNNDTTNGSSNSNRNSNDFTNNTNNSPIIESVYPPSFNNQEILKTAIQFACPCPSQSATVELFTFVLTSGDSKWTFGYCRHPPASTSTALQQQGGQSTSSNNGVGDNSNNDSSPPGMANAASTLFLTFLPWQEIFYRSLNYCAELQTDATQFLSQMYSTVIPEAGTCLYIPTQINSKKPFICACPTDYALPSIPENRNVSEFYNALSTESMISLFAALLSERRIVITSKKLSRLSSIVITCNLFLFPMFWQHIFIPILPTTLQDYLAAPMPFLIGVPQIIWDSIPSEMIGGQLVRVDADTNTVISPFQDEDSLPENIGHPLRKNLTGERVLGDGLARAFLRALAQLMGHYQDAIPEDTQRFDSDLFVRLAHPSNRNYIQEKLLKLQIFQQFIEERVDKVKNGNVESDEFELESLAWRSAAYRGGGGGIGGSRNGLKTMAGQQNKALKKAGKAMMTSVKKEGNHLIDSVKHNSALKSAFRSVKEGGKTVKHKGHVAYVDIKSKFHVPIPSGSLGLNSSKIPRSFEFSSSQSQSQKFTYRSNENSNLSSARREKDDLNNSLNLPRQIQQESHLLSMSSSCSASNLPSSSSYMNSSLTSTPTNEPRIGVGGGGTRIKPRLSKSEENLIDLETPDGISLGFTLENPLYELVNQSSNSVFDDDGTDFIKTDDQLITEYGLNDYFSRLNVSTNSNASFSSQGSAGSSNTSVSQNLVHQQQQQQQFQSQWQQATTTRVTDSPKAVGGGVVIGMIPQLAPPQQQKMDLNNRNSRNSNSSQWATFE